MKLKGVLKDNKGVSEVVAVLVLVAVVIVGAIGVGTIMNGFSNQVADSATSEGISDGAATELLIAGSSTVKPLSECLAPGFSNVNKGVKVTVQGGGSGVGITSTGLDVIDLGSASEDLSVNQTTKWPSIQTHKIGGSAVVFITSPGCSKGTVNISELKACYDSNASTACTVDTTSVTTVYTRSEASGTKETASKYLFDNSGSKIDSAAGTTGTTENSGMKAAVAGCGTTCCLGYVDYGFVDSSVKGMNITDGSNNYEPSSANVLNALKGTYTGYPEKLSRPLNYLTNGDPSVTEQKFIEYAKTYQTANDCFTKTGYFPVWKIEETK